MTFACLRSMASMHVKGVQRVNLIKTSADVVLDKTQAAYCRVYALILGNIAYNMDVLSAGSTGGDAAASNIAWTKKTE